MNALSTSQLLLITIVMMVAKAIVVQTVPLAAIARASSAPKMSKLLTKNMLTATDQLPSVVLKHWLLQQANSKLELHLIN